MGFEQEQEDKKKRQSELKKSMHYKDATSYKSFHEGTSNYLNLVDYYQQKKLKENQEMLKNLGGGLEGDIFSNISEKLEMGDENHDIDLAFYENKKNGKDNIQGLKKAIKGLINTSKDKRVTKILKNLLAKIVPIIDTDGEALKSYGLNTRYEELLGKYDKLKETFEDSEKEEAKQKKAEERAKKKAEEAEKEAKKKAKEKENDDTSEEKPKQKFLTVEQNNLMVRLFPKQARELGLKLILEPGEEEEQQPLPQEEMPAPTPEEQREIIKEMTFSNLSEKVEDKSDEFIENENNFVAKFATAEYKKAREKVTANEMENDEEYEYEDEDDIITEENENIPEAPPVPEELKNASEEKQDNDNKENQKNENGLTDEKEEEEEKEKQDMIDEYTGNGDIKEEQYEYELLRTDYINKIELEISYSARLINNIISEEKAKEETKEEVKKIEEQEQEKDEDEDEDEGENDNENEENITEPLGNDNDDEKLDTTKEETTNQNNNKTNINTDICKFLLKLLRQKESSINTSKIKDIFMTHTMFNTLSANGGMKKDDILEFIFKEDPDDYYDTSDNDKTKIDFSFARFLFRLYYTVSHNLDPQALNDKNQRGPHDLNEETEFTEPYKDLIKGKAKKDEERQKKSLDSLSDLIKEKLDDPKEPNKDVYKQMAKYIKKLHDGKDIKIDTDKIKKLMANYKNTANNSSNLKDKIKMDAPIFKDDNYFKIDSTINNENKSNDKSKNNNP